MNEWVRIRVLGKPLLEKYSWAIPDRRSLKILSSFSPLIEIGAGKGYWASLLRDKDVDIVAFDNDKDNKDTFTTVALGNEKILKNKSYKNRNLFLCYPDENYELAIKCLENFDGEHIIHVGELIYGEKTKSSSQSPWGRSSSSIFQVLLMEEFHCILMADLTLRFPFTSDTISVWKRTSWIEGLADSDAENDVNDDDHDDDDDDNDDNNEDDNIDENDDHLWAAIEKDEVLPVDRAIQSLSYLLHG